jgi:hypothetical protein
MVTSDQLCQQFQTPIHEEMQSKLKAMEYRDNGQSPLDLQFSPMLFPTKINFWVHFEAAVILRETNTSVKLNIKFRLKVYKEPNSTIFQ